MHFILFFFSPSNQHPIYNCIQNLAFCFPVTETKQEFCFSPFVLHLNARQTPYYYRHSCVYRFVSQKGEQYILLKRIAFWERKTSITNSFHRSYRTLEFSSAFYTQNFVNKKCLYQCKPNNLLLIELKPYLSNQRIIINLVNSDICTSGSNYINLKRDIYELSSEFPVLWCHAYPT